MSNVHRPDSNTGSATNKTMNTPAGSSQGLAVSIDWVQGVVSLPNLHGLEYLFDFLNDVPAWTDTKPIYLGRHFQFSCKSARGSIVAWNNAVTSGGRLDCLVSFGGSSLSSLTTLNDSRYFLLACLDLGLNFTRLDLACDDYSKSFSPLLLFNAYKSGFNRHFTKADFINLNLDDRDRGFTCYLGSRTSDKLVRYYDKSVESGGRINSYRWETAFRDENAINSALYLGTIDPLDFKQSIKSLIFGCLDFVDDDGKRLDWWQDYLNFLQVQPLKLPVGRLRPSLQRSMKWINNQVETTLAMVYDFLGPDAFTNWLHERLSSGRSRYRGIHEAMILESLKSQYKEEF